MGIDCYYDDLNVYNERPRGGDRPSPYPIYPAYRGAQFTHPHRLQVNEFNPQAYEMQGLAHDAPWAMAEQARETQYAMSVPQVHRIEGPYLNLERNIRNNSRVMAPQLRSSIYQPGAYERPADVEDSAPSPEIVPSYGQWTAAPHDMVHTVPKEILDYDYAAVSQQDIADRARLALRKAVYGR